MKEDAVLRRRLITKDKHMELIQLAGRLSQQEPMGS